MKDSQMKDFQFNVGTQFNGQCPPQYPAAKPVQKTGEIAELTARALIAGSYLYERLDELEMRLDSVLGPLSASAEQAKQQNQPTPTCTEHGAQLLGIIERFALASHRVQALVARLEC